MKKLMFYCQHILEIGHLVRSMEIVRGLVTDFEICFVNGGKAIAGFEIPAGVEVVNLPAIECSFWHQLNPTLTFSDIHRIC